MDLQLKQFSVRHNSGIYVFLKTDGAINSVSGCTVAGDVIRNNKWEWILGYNRSLGKGSAKTAKLWGLLDGRLILQKQGYNVVIIRSDNLENMISINERMPGGSKNALIRRIQQILAFEESWYLTYSPRETNRIAGVLVKMALSSVDSLHIFAEPP
ncbi:hypothetical protein J1N35_001523 [Gossypium stocksii]|uniref:RNase H type-1 domain-containing protein n=1 Tax=Gossypium stocksii TaxID=47602 RepID=A0A9D3WK27_9ROSI|nr:hypothetical protein J1N35_001523 [Gossypium stocksii]